MARHETPWSVLHGDEEWDAGGVPEASGAPLGGEGAEEGAEPEAAAELKEWPYSWAQPEADHEGPFPASRVAVLALEEEVAAAAAASAADLADSRRDLEARLGNEDEEDEEAAPHGMEAEEDGIEGWGDFPPWVPLPRLPAHQLPAASDAGEADVKEEEKEGSEAEDPADPGAEVKEEDDHPWVDEAPTRSPREEATRTQLVSEDYSLSRLSPRPGRESLLSFADYDDHFGQNRLGLLAGYSPFERYSEEARGSREAPPEELVPLPGPSHPTLVMLPGPSPREPPARTAAHAQALEPEPGTWTEPELTPRPSHRAGGRELTPEPPVVDGDLGPDEGQASPPRVPGREAGA